MRIAMLGIKGIPCPAGAENVAEQLGARLVARGHQVTVYVRPHYTPREVREYRGIRLVHLPSIPTKNFDAITHSALATFQVLRSRPDVVHIHSIGSALFAPLPRLFRIPSVVQSHGLDWQRAKWGALAKTYLRLSDLFFVNFPTAATAVSQKMQRYYAARYNRPVHYIPNGVSPAQPIPPQEIHKLGLEKDGYILFAARLVKEKGCHYLLEAYGQLGCPSKKLVIAGDAKYADCYADGLKSQACENILFPGFVQGRLLQELLSNAYLYVLPSEIEGLSTGLLEAMSYGNCVLVSDIEENLEATGDAGLSFRSADPADLKSKLAYLLDHPEVTHEYRARAQAHVRTHFDWDRVTDQYEALYTSLLSPHRLALANP